MRILWLASWYPNMEEPYSGDFIQRHAQAASLYNDIQVIFVQRDSTGVFTKDKRVVQRNNGRLKETIIYYYHPANSWSSLERVLSNLSYIKLFKQAIKDYVEECGVPHAIHVHSGMKAGLAALWAHRKFKSPLLVTEHWTGFLEEEENGFYQLSSYLQNKWKQLHASATGISAVSSYLLGKIARVVGSPTKIVVIPNVVNTEIFKPAINDFNDTLRLLFIAGHPEQKNPEAIIAAISQLVKEGRRVQLTIAGPGQASIQSLVERFQLERYVHVLGEQPQPVLATLMHQSNALIIYSHFETFGCVVIEAMASGRPVIASDIEPMKELVQPGKNGFLVPANDPIALAKALSQHAQELSQMDAIQIADHTKAKFGYEQVGLLFDKWYSDTLGISNDKQPSK